MPKDIEEIGIIRKKIFMPMKKFRLKTDIKYFMKVVDNILVKKKRSA